MLSQLFINNIAVIEKASIDFEEGFNVLTGETGAGKSIIIDAIHAVIGERTSKELVRSGAKTASVSALFTLPKQELSALLQEYSIPEEEDGTILIQREIRLEGKSVCKINGAPATVTMLKSLGPRLLTIHGQHESYELLSPDVHMAYLDSFAMLEPLLKKYQCAYQNLRETLKRMKALNVNQEEKERRAELLQYQINEIETAGIHPGQVEALTRERDSIRNREMIATAVEISQMALIGDENTAGVLSELDRISGEMGKAMDFFSELAPIQQKVLEAKYLLEDVEITLRSTPTDFDVSSLNLIEAQLDSFHKLSRKYGETEEDILSFLEKCKAELSQLEFMDEERESLELRCEEEKQKAIDLARELSRKRQESAAQFTYQVKKELAFLNMPGIEFQVQTQRVPLYTMGCDKMQFLISVNKGEEPKPMSKIASGGELSRIMLAIKTVLSGKDGVDTLIFDEVDTGISGEAANKVGLKLKQVSKNRQVLCITHLAQIAALTDCHYHISKTTKDDRTFTQVTVLDLDARKRELARIIGGEDITALQLEMAEEMIKKGLTI